MNERVEVEADDPCLGCGEHAPFTPAARAHHVGPLGRRQRGSGVVGEFDLVVDDARENRLQRLPRPIFPPVGPAVVPDELLERHLALHLRVVLVRVEHDDAVTQHVRRVRVRHSLGVGGVIPCRENLEDAGNLLRLAGKLKPVQKRPQRTIQRHALKVEDVAVLGERGDVEVLVVAEILPDNLFILRAGPCTSIHHWLPWFYFSRSSDQVKEKKKKKGSFD